MKSKFSLRFLCIISFMLLICPFYDRCNGKGFKKTEEVAVEAQADDQSQIINGDFTKINEQNLVDEKIVTCGNQTSSDSFIDFIDDGDSENAFEIAAQSSIIFTCNIACQIIGFKSSLKDSDWKELFFGITNVSFAFIIFFTFLRLIICFSKKVKWLHRFSLLILIFLAIALICIPFDGLFEKISQIKWGFYLFIVVNIYIFWYNRKLLKTLNSSPD